MGPPDIVESQQWTTVTNRKSKSKAKASSSNMVGISTRKTEEDVACLTSSGEEESVFAGDTGTPHIKDLIRQAVLEIVR